MKTYITADGETLVARDARQVVRKLRAAGFYREDSVEAFMVAVAQRVRRKTGCRVATSSDAEFVSDLIRAGILQEQEKT
jgi:hypothetical protein